MIMLCEHANPGKKSISDFCHPFKRKIPRNLLREKHVFYHRLTGGVKKKERKQKISSPTRKSTSIHGRAGFRDTLRSFSYHRLIGFSGFGINLSPVSSNTNHASCSTKYVDAVAQQQDSVVAGT